MQLHQQFIRTAKTNKTRIAVYDQATGKDLTYNKMLIASIILARKFSAYREHYVGVMVPTSAGCMLTMLAILMNGKVPVMINYSTGARENALYAQDKCSFRTIITSKKLIEKLGIDPIRGMVFIEDIMKEVTIKDKLSAASISLLPTPILSKMFYSGSMEEDIVILFTSGSEKNPKTVQLSHKNINHQLININKILNLLPNEIFIANLPYFHVFGLTITFWLPIVFGFSIVAHANPLDYKAIVDSIKKYAVTIIVGTPTFYYGYLKKASKGDFSSLRVAISGADKLPDHLRDLYQKEHGVDLMEGYGTTETSPVISTNIGGSCRPGSVGKLLPNVKVRIVDRETGEDLPVGKEGKIIVKGDLVMTGYLGDLEETSLRVRNGWYDTGDMGVLDRDGYLWHRGRLRRFVKIGGEMVSLVKIENELEKLMPEDAICCVVDVPNPYKGADIIAAFTTKDINIKQLLKHLSKKLPSIAIPKEFFLIEDIPMMGSGKVNFREVEKICREWQLEKNHPARLK
ncbi:MAG: AMP-binding protein [Candidatus Cloacimonetes bacterium]|nr:AMP-binding protein [Candidatus Cloacimonadota bacterium]